MSLFFLNTETPKLCRPEVSLERSRELSREGGYMLWHIFLPPILSVPPIFLEMGRMQFQRVTLRVQFRARDSVSFWLAIVRGWHTMENGPNANNGEKLGKTWQMCPDRKLGPNSRQIPPKWEIGPIFHFFGIVGYFFPIFVRCTSSTTFFVIFPHCWCSARFPLFASPCTSHDCKFWPPPSSGERAQ